MDRRNFMRALGAGSGMLLANRTFNPRLALADDLLDKDVYLDRVDQIISRGPFADTWESLAAYTAPEWYKDAKFGIFIHWGVYSVPAWWSEWYPREMYRMNNLLVWPHHRMKWGPQDKFGYKDFIPMFKAESYDPDAWADLFKKAGARYVIPVAEHHDGFAMYDCGFSEWTAVKMGPKRDLIGDLARSVRSRGLWFGLSSHRAAHWFFMNGGRKFKSDVNDPRFQDFYGPAKPMSAMPDEPFMRDWLARSAELVDLYQPNVFWFDFGFNRESFEPYRKKLAAYYYNRAAEWGEEVVLNYKNHAFPDGTAVLDLERSGLNEIRPMVWQTDTSVSFMSWGYIEGPYERIKSPTRLVHDLIDTVSKNGVLLLNVGPRPDGVIPDEQSSVLLEIGKWLSINGDAIYGTRPWKVFGEGPTRPSKNPLFGLGEMMAKNMTPRDVRFTTKNGKLYAILMGWPKNGKVEIKSLGKDSGLAPGEITEVRLLGHEGSLKWDRTEKALTITLSESRPCEHAVALEISGLEFSG